MDWTHVQLQTVKILVCKGHLKIWYCCYCW